MSEALRQATNPGEEAQISRDMLREMDEAATSREHWKILITSGMGFFTDAYDLFVIGVVVSILVTEWGIASWQKSLVSSLALLTSAIGAVVFGRVADKFGRKKIYGYEVLVLAVGAILSALSPNIWWLLIFRAILGFGIGGDYPVSATIMSEYASKKNRGRMVSLVFSMQGAGLIVGPLLAIALLSTGMNEDYVWRILLAFGAIPALAVFWLRRQIKETPRFVLAQMEARETEEKAKREGKPTGLRGALADRTMLKWLIGCSLAWMLFDFVYYGNTIASQSILSLVAPNASLQGQTAYILAVFAIAALPGYFLAAFTIDKIGRRTVQAFGFAMMTLVFVVMWLVPKATTEVAPFLVLFGATYFFAEFGPNTTTFVYPAEIFPVRVRTTCHGIAAAAGKIGAFIGTYALTSMLNDSGVPRVAMLVAIVSLGGLLATVTLLPEPRGKSLEDMSERGAGAEYPPSAVALGVSESRGTRIS